MLEKAKRDLKEKIKKQSEVGRRVTARRTRTTQHRYLS